MRLGYNTNGLAHHRLVDAIDLLADEGYKALPSPSTPGPSTPTTIRRSSDRQVDAVRSALDRHGLARVIETGARYLLNPRLKHDPTLMDPDPARRAVRSEFLRRAIDMAEALDADASRSGPAARRLPPSRARAWTGLRKGCGRFWPMLSECTFRWHLSPSPACSSIHSSSLAGWMSGSITRCFSSLSTWGTSIAWSEGDIPALIRAWGPRIVNVHIEDMARGVHDHLMFGEGTMDFPPICRALAQIGYPGGVHVELSRHSHAGVEAARAAAAFLGPLLSRPIPERS